MNEPSEVHSAEPAPASERRPIERWRTAKGTEPWLFAALKAFKRWGIGSEATEAEYDTAARETASIRVGISA